MKPNFHCWKFARLALGKLSLCLLFLPSVYADIQSIHIIKSSDNAFFQRSVETLIKNTRGQIKFHISTLASPTQSMQQDIEPDLVVTMGINAAEYSMENHEDTPVIHSYITEFQRLQYHHKCNHSTVLLDQPLSRYLDFIKLLLPVKTVGILNSTTHIIEPKLLNQYSLQSGLNIEQSIVQDDNNLLEILRNLLERNEVLLGLPSPNIYNRQTLKGILLTSYRMNKPMISYSPSHVKSGALASIYTSPEQIGTQLSGIINQYINDENYRPENYVYASYFNVVFNRKVAESLNLQLPDEADILQALKQDEN